MRSTNNIIGMLLVATLLVNGCAPTLKRVDVSKADVDREREKQLELMVVSQVKQANRLQDVSLPLLVAANKECGKDTLFKFGYQYHQKNMYPEKLREAAARALGATDRLTVLHVVPGMPAEKAGLRKGDKVLRINKNDLRGKLLTAEDVKALIFSPNAEHKTGKVKERKCCETNFDDDNNDLPAQQDVPTMEWEVERDGNTFTVKTEGIRACKYPVNLVANDVVNAYADGRQVVVFSGLLRFTESDAELAMVVAHEISHNTLGHIQKKQANAIPGLAIDILLAGVGIPTGGAFSNATGNAYAQEFESEADYSGLHIAARAGVDISIAANFWRRLGAEHPGSIAVQYGASHPSTPERFVAMEKTVEEIRGKQSLGVAVVPDKRDGSPPPAPAVVAVSPAVPPVAVAKSPEKKTESPTRKKGDCSIKGAILFTKKIYFKPGDENYPDVTISKERGEKMFCTEEEAKTAGFLPITTK